MMRIISMLFFLLLCSLPAIAGKLTGKITDEKTGETIIGASVKLKGTETFTITDIDGNFMLELAPGTHTLEIKYSGYNVKEVDDVVITDAAPANLNITLAPQNRNNIKEVVVRSSFKKENINALYATQKTSATIQDGISADVIRKSPDRSTGEVLKRVSGTTIQDNKFVIVRGLSDRYNTALVDNAILPSTEPNRKAFSFDIIPAALIDNITITKAATPDLPGDFAGGVINILTKEIPTQNFTTLSLGLNANTVSTGSKFQSGYRASTDFLGFDDGSRQLPASFPSPDVINSGTMTQKEQIAALQKLNNDFNIKEHTAMPGLNLQALMGRAYNRGNGNKFGFSAALTYTHTEIIRRDVKRFYDNYNYSDDINIYSSNLGALLNAGYSTAKSKFVFKSLYNRIFDDQFLNREGINFGNTSDVRYYAFDLVQKSLLKFSLEGDHQAGSGQGKLNWLVAFNNVTNNQPDQRKVSYQRAQGTDLPFSADNTTLGKANNRLFSDLNEQIGNVNLNYSTPISIFKQSSFKVGVFGQYRQRAFDNNYLGATLNQGQPDEVMVRQLPIGELYNATLIKNGYYRLSNLTIGGDKYDATTTTAAGYAMMDNKLSDKLRIVWGVRAENYQVKLESGASTGVDRSWTDILPSAHFTYALNAKSNLRASYFRSVARPELREMAGDLSYYDYELNANITGQYNLERTQIDNADLRYEIYPGIGEIFSASVFYKHFKNPIENKLNGANSAYDISPINSPTAVNIGAEMEIRKGLDFIAPGTMMKNFNFYLNLAYIHSKLDYAAKEFLPNGDSRTSRPLSGQSPYVINTSLGYTTTDGQLALNVLYNRIGDRIYLVGADRFGDVYESARDLLDFQANWNINKHSELRLNIKDVLSSPVRLYFDQNNNKKFEEVKYSGSNINPVEDWVLQEYRPGSFFTLSFIYKF
jgi:TonB-dependent receptor